MNALIIAILLTVLFSALFSLLEALILSTTVTEVEMLKQQSPKVGTKLERYISEMEDTTSALLTLNTIANTSGTAIVGYFAGQLFDAKGVTLLTSGFIVCILLFSEILPKNIGVNYRTTLLPFVTPIIGFIRVLMRPFSFIGKSLVRIFTSKKQTKNNSEQEIALLATKSATEGNLSLDERNLILNSLKIDDVSVRDIMTPRTVVEAIEGNETVADIFKKYKHIPFGRLPVYKENIDQVLGVVRRRDLLVAWGEDKDNMTVKEFAHPCVFIPEHATALDALQSLIKEHEKLAIVVDEFGNTGGVISLEDIFETILGKEIFEHDDVAVDMREFAKQKNKH